MRWEGPSKAASTRSKLSPCGPGPNCGLPFTSQITAPASRHETATSLMRMSTPARSRYKAWLARVASRTLSGWTSPTGTWTTRPPAERLSRRRKCHERALGRHIAGGKLLFSQQRPCLFIELDPAHVHRSPDFRLLQLECEQLLDGVHAVALDAARDALQDAQHLAAMNRESMPEPVEVLFDQHTLGQLQRLLEGRDHAGLVLQVRRDPLALVQVGGFHDHRDSRAAAPRPRLRPAS